MCLQGGSGSPMTSSNAETDFKPIIILYFLLSVSAGISMCLQSVSMCLQGVSMCLQVVREDRSASRRYSDAVDRRDCDELKRTFTLLGDVWSAWDEVGVQGMKWSK